MLLYSMQAAKCRKGNVSMIVGTNLEVRRQRRRDLP
jgi:hypothetical protein